MGSFADKIATYQASPAEPSVLRIRATITIDLDVVDYTEAKAEQGKIEARFLDLQRSYAGARLEFHRRKPRENRRPAAPRLYIAPYCDD